MSDEAQTIDRARKQVQEQMGPPIELDYAAPAELFPFGPRNGHGRGQIKYKRFETAAEAIRFAIEDVSPPALLGAYLEVDEARFGRHEIRHLYDSAAYPLQRRKAQLAVDELNQN